MSVLLKFQERKGPHAAVRAVDTKIIQTSTGGLHIEVGDDKASETRFNDATGVLGSHPMQSPVSVATSSVICEKIFIQLRSQFWMRKGFSIVSLRTDAT